MLELVAGKSLGFHVFAGIGDDGIDMLTGVGIHSDDIGVGLGNGLREDSHTAWYFLLFTDRIFGRAAGTSPGRKSPLEQHCDGSHPDRWTFF